MATCRSCGREIEWVQVVKSGKSMPIDLFPRADGNVKKLVSEAQNGMRLVEVLGKRAIEEDTGERFVSHFTTCPQADQHRRK